MWSAGWARGVMMVMEECGIKLRGAYPGQGAPIKRSSPSMLSIAEREGGDESGMKYMCSSSRSRRRLSSVHSSGGVLIETHYGALNEISKRQFRLRSANGD